MPRGNRIKTKTKKLVNDGELTDMFNKMLGMEEPDPEIAKPRCESFEALATILATSAKKFSENEILLKHFPNEKENLKKINNFSIRLFDLIKKVSTAYTLPNIGKVYAEIKKDSTAKSLFVIHTQLKIYKQYIEDLNTLSDSFIIDEVGYEIYPFRKICKMNLYPMWAKEPPKHVKRYILIFLHQMYKTTKKICELMMRPDVDIGKFSRILVDCISQARKLIPNCNDAFNRIENAVDMLENNFNDYYKDFIKTENPSIIFLDFIGDVSHAQKNTDLKLIVQFRKIIKYFQNASAGQNNDPRMKSIFKALNQNVSMLEKDVVGASENESEESSNDETETTKNDENSFENVFKK